MHTSITNVFASGVRTVHAYPKPGRTSGYAVHHSKRGWIVQPWVSQRHGQAFGDPVAGPFRLREDAAAARREMLRAEGE